MTHHPYIKAVTFTPGHDHSARIEWPNGMGYTPCTQAYADLHAEAEAVKPSEVNMDDLSPEDYQRWNVLTDRLASMHADGHLGKSVRY